MQCIISTPFNISLKLLTDNQRVTKTFIAMFFMDEEVGISMIKLFYHFYAALKPWNLGGSKVRREDEKRIS